MGLVGLLLGGLIFYSMAIGQVNGEKTNCYDGFKNKINGQICTVEGNFDSKEMGYLIGGLLMLMVTFVFGFMGYVMDDLSRSFSRW